MARSAAFQPLRKLQGLEKFPEAERALLDQLNAIRLDLARLQAPTTVTELKATDYLARAGETVRCAPGSGGMTLLLPTPTKEIQGESITLLVESVDLSSLVIQCVDGLVSGVSSQTVALACRIDFVCDGLEGWRSEVPASSVPLTDGDKGDITVSSLGTVFSIDALAVGTAELDNLAVTTGKLAANAVTNAKAAQMAARRIKGREDGAGTGDQQDLTGAEVGEILRFVSTQSDSTSTGTIATYTLAEGTNIVRFLVGVGAAIALRGATIPVEEGQFIIWENNDGTGSTVTFNHEDGSAAAAGNRFRCPGAANYALTAGHRLITCYINTRHRIIATA